MSDACHGPRIELWVSLLISVRSFSPVTKGSFISSPHKFSETSEVPQLSRLPARPYLAKENQNPALRHWVESCVSASVSDLEKSGWKKKQFPSFACLAFHAV